MKAETTTRTIPQTYSETVLFLDPEETAVLEGILRATVRTDPPMKIERLSIEGSQGVAYVKANPWYTFQVAGCSAANPTDVDPIIHYMQQADIHYAWATGWLGDPITFKTNSAILVTEPHGRIPTNSSIVLHADRPSILLLAHHTDLHPAFLDVLDARKVEYHIQRFYAAPGVDALVITPLNQTVSPLDPYFTALFHRVFFGCLI